MRDDITAYGDFPFIAYAATADARFQQITHLATKIGVRDLRIAAIALANNLTVLTGNTRDFTVVPGLTFADWTV
jgi:tRNA(fMet)-specific endonuclease VapC